MEPITLSIVLSIVLVLMMFYFIQTHRAAVKERELVVEKVHAILADEMIGEKTKNIARGLFHLSLSQSLLPKTCIFVLRRRFFGLKYTPPVLTDYEKTRLSEITQKLLFVNLLAAPALHLLALMALLIFSEKKPVSQQIETIQREEVANCCMA